MNLSFSEIITWEENNTNKTIEKKKKKNACEIIIISLSGK